MGTALGHCMQCVLFWCCLLHPPSLVEFSAIEEIALFFTRRVAEGLSVSNLG